MADAQVVVPAGWSTTISGAQTQQRDPMQPGRRPEEIAHPTTREEILALPRGTPYVWQGTYATRGSSDEARRLGVRPEELKPGAQPPRPPSQQTGSTAAPEGNWEAVNPAQPPAPRQGDWEGRDQTSLPTVTSPMGGPLPQPGAGVSGAPSNVAQTEANTALRYRVFHGIASPADTAELNRQSLLAAQAGRNFWPPGAGLPPGMAAPNYLTQPPGGVPPPGAAPQSPLGGPVPAAGAGVAGAPISPQQALAGVADRRSQGLLSQDGATSFVANAPPGAFGPPNPLLAKPPAPPKPLEVLPAKPGSDQPPWWMQNMGGVG